MNRRLMLERAAEALAAWNRGDAEGAVEHVAEDVIWRDVALRMPVHGRMALRKAVQAYMTAFPDLRLEITSSTLDGPRLAQEWTLTGTHSGRLLGLPPTGRWTRTYGVTITTFDEDGVMIEGALYWNPLATFRQLGLADQTGTIATAAITASSAPVASTARTRRAEESGGASARSSSPAAT
jgi:steroid delta-isomerase-like uncharacterized protein